MAGRNFSTSDFLGAWDVLDRFAHDAFDGGRVFHGEKAYEWFDRWL